ncbi:MAG: ABA4-like family protein [Pseudomonadota bacterium]|nr:ABA4-like family protein [Pseudomonadota bacterium]
MNWDFLFGFTNTIALVGWLALALLPRGPSVMALVLYAGVAMLCLIYAVLFVLLFGRLVDLGLVTAATGQGGFTSIEGIRQLFATDGGIVVGWTHYLAFDLFVGLWIAKDADHKSFSRLVQIPFLFATLMAGPIGLLLWLVVRERRARRAARAAA